MHYSTRRLKSAARESLRGRYGVAISAILFYGLLNMTINLVTNLLFQEDSVLTQALSWVFSFIISLIMCIFSAGLNYLFLNISRKKESRFSDLFYLFGQHPDRVILAGLVLTLLNLLSMAPVNLAFTYLPEMGFDNLQASYLLLGILFLSLILSVVLTLPFTFTYFFLADSPDMGAGAALKASMGLCRKHFGKLLSLEFSFLGLGLLSVFSLYVALLWVIPYMQTSLAYLYRYGIGELDPPPIPHVIQEPCGDDYNSEA